MSEQLISVALPSSAAYVTGTVNGVSYVWTNVEANTWETTAPREENETYLVVLEIVDTNGFAYTREITLYYGILNLITDRTSEDVERWQRLRDKGWAAMSEEERAEWISPMKGSYNASDMNRVECAVSYVAGRLRASGYYIDPVVKTTWSIYEIPTRNDLNRYYNNVAELREVIRVYETTPEAPTTAQKLDYKGANALEQILKDVDELLTKMVAAAFYSGEIYAMEV